MVGWSRCPHNTWVRPVAASHSISPPGAWQTHRRKVKMKSFESNLQGNRLLLLSRGRSMRGHTGQGQERKTFSFFSGQRWGHLHLTSSIIETSAGQRGPGGFNICLHDMTSYLHFTPSHCCLPPLRTQMKKSTREGSPVPLVRVHYLTRRGRKRQRGLFAGGPLSHADFFPKRSRRNAGPGQECQTQNTTRHSLRADTSTMPERKRNVLYCASNCSSIMEMHFLVKR